MKGAPEADPSRCTGISKPLAGGNAFCIPDGRGELKAAVTGEVVAQPFERLKGTGTIRAHPFWKGSQKVQPAAIEPENKLEGADKSSCGDGGGFSENFRICRAPGRELKTCCELLCVAGRLCAQQRQSGAVRNLQMGSVTLTLQPEQAKAKHSS